MKNQNQVKIIRKFFRKRRKTRPCLPLRRCVSRFSRERCGSLIRSAGLARSLPRCYLDLCIYCWQSIHYRVNSRPFCYPRSGMQIRCATCLSSQVNRRAEARVRPCSNNNNRVVWNTVARLNNNPSYRYIS